MTHTFTKGEYKTRCGTEAVVLAEEGRRLVGYLRHCTGDVTPADWDHNGNFRKDDQVSPCDLMPPTPADPYTQGWNEALEAALAKSNNGCVGIEALYYLRRQP